MEVNTGILPADILKILEANNFKLDDEQRESLLTSFEDEPSDRKRTKLNV